MTMNSTCYDTSFVFRNDMSEKWFCCLSLKTNNISFCLKVFGTNSVLKFITTRALWAPSVVFFIPTVEWFPTLEACHPSRGQGSQSLSFSYFIDISAFNGSSACFCSGFTSEFFSFLLCGGKSGTLNGAVFVGVCFFLEGFATPWASFSYTF